MKSNAHIISFCTKLLRMMFLNVFGCRIMIFGRFELKTMFFNCFAWFPGNAPKFPPDFPAKVSQPGPKNPPPPLGCQALRLHLAAVCLLLPGLCKICPVFIRQFLSLGGFGGSPQKAKTETSPRSHRVPHRTLRNFQTKNLKKQIVFQGFGISGLSKELQEPRQPQDSPRQTETGPRQAQDSPRQPKTAPRQAQDSPKTAQDSPRQARDRPRQAQEAPRQAQDSLIFGPKTFKKQMVF